jgi:hypothetical protein
MLQNVTTYLHLSCEDAIAYLGWRLRNEMLIEWHLGLQNMDSIKNSHLYRVILLV